MVTADVGRGVGLEEGVGAEGRVAVANHHPAATPVRGRVLHHQRLPHRYARHAAALRFGIRVSGFGFRILGFGFWVESLGIRIYLEEHAARVAHRAVGLGFRV